ncbi:MAG TPA: type VI secretion system-associated FHA domain protein TagH [Burkholderiaceae bacterium]|jgi:FHA domain-containing protein
MIKLTAVSYNNQASLTPLSAVFGRDGGTLGRSDENFFVLPDPKNLISRVQASIKSDGARHTIVNLSQASPILLNGKEIEFEREYPFNAGDEMQIGLYILRAEPHLVAVDGAAGAQQEWPEVSFPPTMQEIRAVPKPPSTPVPEEVTVGAAAMPVATPAVAPPAPTARAIPNLAELHQKKSEASAQRSRQSAAETSTPDEDKSHAGDQSAPDGSGAENDALMQAFLKGAGIPNVSLNAGMTPEFMEMLGKLLATSIKGTFQLLATRASIKREVKADVTMVVVRNNNPLKFLSDSETVLTQMLRKKMPGFMGPSEALQDAFADLHAHQSGMIAGMNGAISEVLKRFNPAALEERIKSPTFFDSVVPLHRKAKMWDQYDSLFEEINKEAQKDYQKLFGKAFLKAYEKEIERSRNEEHDGQ